MGSRSAVSNVHLAPSKRKRGSWLVTSALAVMAMVQLEHGTSPHVQVAGLVSWRNGVSACSEG